MFKKKITSIIKWLKYHLPMFRKTYIQEIEEIEDDYKKSLMIMRTAYDQLKEDYKELEKINKELRERW